MPVLTSIRIRGLMPAWPAAQSSSRTLSGLSTATITSASRASQANRRVLIWPTTWLAIRMSRIPAAAITSASLTLAQVTPIAPAAISLWTMAGVLLALLCGRHWAPRAAISAAMVAML